MIDRTRTSAPKSERASSLSRLFRHFVLISLIAVVVIPVAAGVGLWLALRHVAMVDSVVIRAGAVVTVTVLAAFSALVFMMYRATQQAKASAAALRESEKRGREAERMASVGVLAGGIAHKFNNLLTGVLGNVELILPELPDGSPLREPMEEIRAAATRAAELTGQMLAYAGKGLVVVEDVDLSGLIREMAPTLNALTAEGTTLNYALADGLPLIKGGPAQIKQVIAALVTNAAEAVGDEGGTIAIITRDTQAGPENPLRNFQGERLPDGRYAVIEVADTGSGMDEQAMARIFDPFFTTRFTGRGLGLAATLGIVRGHNGAINVESKPGEGTSVCVFLPCPPEPVASSDTE